MELKHIKTKKKLTNIVQNRVRTQNVPIKQERKKRKQNKKNFFKLEQQKKS